MDGAAWDERYATAELVWSAGPNRFVAEELAGLSPGTALDLAAGEGRNAIWLARQGWRVTAVDFSQVGLARGAELAGELPIAWVCADVTGWVAPMRVDLVVVAYLQLPAEQRRAALACAWQSLADGGTLLWVAHDSTNLTDGTGGPQDPAVLMTAEDLLADLDALGAEHEVVRAERVARDVAEGHGEDESATAWDCLLRVTRNPPGP